MNQKHLGIVLGVCIAFGIVAASFLFLLPKKQSSPTTSIVQPTSAPTTAAQDLPGQQIIIKVTAGGFYPATTTIKSNTRIVWVNETDKKVTVNSDDHPTHKKYPFLNLGEFSKGQAVQTVLKEKGTYHYHNHLSPTVRGTIVVE